MDESLAKHLRQIARDEEASEKDEALWIDRAAGRLTPAAERSLAERATTDDAAQFMRALTEPRGDALADRIATSIGLPAAIPAQAPANVTPIGSLRARKAAYLAAPLLAAAAALFLWVRVPARSGVAALPGYAMTIEGVDERERGAPSAVDPNERLTLSAGAHVDVVARPVENVDAPVVARGLLVRGSEVRPLGIPGQVSPSGAIRFDGSFQDVFGATRGDWDLVVVIAPSGAPLTREEESAAAVAGKAPDKGSILRRPLRLVDRR